MTDNTKPSAKAPETDYANNPGGANAVANGCKCPRMDNGHGRGYMGGPHFVISETCPLHSGRKA